MARTFGDFLRSLLSQRKRQILLVALVAAFWLVPPKLLFPVPILEPKNPVVRELSLQIPDLEVYPFYTGLEPQPYLSAHSAIVVDVDSKAVIYMKNPNQRLYPASTTKMVTALVALDEYDFNKVASISSPLRIGRVMGLYDGEQIKIESLMQGLLIHSANDSAEALAKIDPDGRSAFIAKMNQKVRSLGLKDTNFVNPTGFDQYNHYSSVHDLAVIGTEIISKPELSSIVEIKYLIVTDEGGEIVHELESTNQLLGNLEGIKGVKTGWTEYAGECLVTVVERDGHTIVTAILGSLDRFGETERLVEWVWANHTWSKIELPE
jgi:D-alanyl-D-alanine carboxypeptidase (penicillin-binding protein 5/6)